MPIGIKLTNDYMYLTRGRDFEWVFANLDNEENEIDFPAGELFFEIYNGDDTVVWDFVIDGSRASLKVEHVDADEILDRVKWQLVWLEDGEAAGGEVVSLGTVKVQGR